MDKIFFHIDANCFFARCEEILNPSLESKAFVVANQHQYAIISCASKEARKYHIKAAMNIMQARKLCSDLIVIEPHYDWYKKKSNELFRSIKEFFKDEIEIMSIDECYVDVTFSLTKYHNNLKILAYSLIDYIKQKTNLDVSIGAGNNKFLAKTASDLKSIHQFEYINKNQLEQKIWSKLIDDIFMIGKKTSNILKNLNIFYVKDFLNFNNQELLKSILKKKYYILVNYFKALYNDTINNNLDKSISQSNTLNELSNNYDYLLEIIRWLCDELYLLLISRKILTNHITIQIKYFDKSNNLISKSKGLLLNEFTNNKKILFIKVINTFNLLWNNQKLKLIGISYDNLQSLNSFKKIKQNKL